MMEIRHQTEIYQHAVKNTKRNVPQTLKRVRILFMHTLNVRIGTYLSLGQTKGKPVF